MFINLEKATNMLHFHYFSFRISLFLIIKHRFMASPAHVLDLKAIHIRLQINEITMAAAAAALNLIICGETVISRSIAYYSMCSY